MTNLVSHTLFSEFLVITFVWHVGLSFSNTTNGCHYHIKLIAMCTSGKDVVIFVTDTLISWISTVGAINLV